MNKNVKTVMYPISLKFIEGYIITMRPYLLFVSGITGIAGMSFTNNQNWQYYLAIFTASFLAYGFGQALTDCFQMDTDSISAPYRPLTQGLLSKSQTLIVSVLGLIYCMAVFGYFNHMNIILGVLSGLGLATYTPFKRRWWGGPFYNSWIVAVLFIMSFLSGKDSIFSDSIIFSILSIFFGYANFVLSGYFKDIEADRVTGYNTFPVVFGRKKSAIVSDSFAFLHIFFTGLALIFILDNSNNYYELMFVLVFYLASSIVSIISQLKLHLVKTDDQAHGAIVLTVHSYILSISSIVVAVKPNWLTYIILFYIGFIITLKLRPSISQV
jgi:4-hydroxybenzoate polyprenyltransferase